MNIEKLSPSAYKEYSNCPHAFFIGYNLYRRYPAGIAACRGTIAHRVIEILCEQILAEKNGRLEFDTPELGERVSVASNFNIDKLGRAVFEYQTKEVMPHHNWTEKDFQECMKYVNVALSFQNGKFDPRNRNVIDTERRIDLEIDEDWAILPSGKKMRIVGYIDMVCEVGDKLYEIVDWKGLPVDTPILTENGWVKMEDLKIGDIVFDQEGQKTKIIGKSEPSFKECYKIEFDDRSSIVCDNEHLWKLSNGETKAVTQLKIGDRIPVVKPINFDHQDLPIDPYVLGVWLASNQASWPGDLEEEAANLMLLGGNKHVPVQYMVSSIAQRSDLLRGLQESGQSTIWEEDLILSLGQRRDYESCDAEKECERFITNIEKQVLHQKTQCIKVDSPSETYVCGYDYIVTHNTGQQKDFHTGEILNEETLRNDIQLKMYHYAATKIYGEHRDYLVTIFFLKTKTPITIMFHEGDVVDTKEKIRERLMQISKDNNPRRNISYKCRKFCDYGKNTFEGTEIIPLQQIYTDGIARQGDIMTVCDQVYYELSRFNMNWVEENMKYNRDRLV